ncbi:MAG: hypothetical protein M3N49_05845 [Candidatus Eremiobacteraeota bacterium]|nr:hypothetical protein [Candidatus Eremiobacteraeota bacterium]
MQATPAAGVSAAGSARLTLDVPRSGSSAQRAPKYVSPNSAKLVVTVLTVNGNAPTATQVPAGLNPSTFALTTGPGGNCTASPSGETCTVTIPAPTGQVTYQFDVFDIANNELSTNTLTYIIAAGSSPNLQAQLNGIVSTVTVTAPTLAAGTSFSGPITVQAFDASGALIVGPAPYNNPFTLTDNDATGATSLTDGGTTALVVTVAGPNDVVILNFDGEDIDPFTISATVPGKAAATAGTVNVTHSPVTFPGTPNDTQRTTDPNYNQPTVALTAIPQTAQFTAAQVGWSDHGTHGFTVALDPVTCGTGPAAVVTVAPAAGTNNRTFNVTSQNPGVCKGTVTGGPPGHPQSATIWFSVTASRILVN